MFYEDDELDYTYNENEISISKNNNIVKKKNSLTDTNINKQCNIDTNSSEVKHSSYSITSNNQKSKTSNSKLSCYTESSNNIDENSKLKEFESKQKASVSKSTLNTNLSQDEYVELMKAKNERDVDYILNCLNNNNAGLDNKDEEPPINSSKKLFNSSLNNITKLNDELNQNIDDANYINMLINNNSSRLSNNLNDKLNNSFIEDKTNNSKNNLIKNLDRKKNSSYYLKIIEDINNTTNNSIENNDKKPKKNSILKVKEHAIKLNKKHSSPKKLMLNEDLFIIPKKENQSKINIDKCNIFEIDHNKSSIESDIIDTKRLNDNSIVSVKVKKEAEKMFTFYPPECRDDFNSLTNLPPNINIDYEYYKTIVNNTTNRKETDITKLKPNSPSIIKDSSINNEVLGTNNMITEFTLETNNNFINTKNDIINEDNLNVESVEKASNLNKSYISENISKNIITSSPNKNTKYLNINNLSEFTCKNKNKNYNYSFKENNKTNIERSLLKSPDKILHSRNDLNFNNVSNISIDNLKKTIDNVNNKSTHSIILNNFNLSNNNSINFNNKNYVSRSISRSNKTSIYKNTINNSRKNNNKKLSIVELKDMLYNKSIKPNDFLNNSNKSIDFHKDSTNYKKAISYFSPIKNSNDMINKTTKKESSNFIFNKINNADNNNNYNNNFTTNNLNNSIISRNKTTPLNVLSSNSKKPEFDINSTNLKNTIIKNHNQGDKINKHLFNLNIDLNDLINKIQSQNNKIKSVDKTLFNENLIENCIESAKIKLNYAISEYNKYKNMYNEVANEGLIPKLKTKNVDLDMKIYEAKHIIKDLSVKTKLNEKEIFNLENNKDNYNNNNISNSTFQSVNNYNFKINMFKEKIINLKKSINDLSISIENKRIELNSDNSQGIDLNNYKEIDKFLNDSISLKKQKINLQLRHNKLFKERNILLHNKSTNYNKFILEKEELLKKIKAIKTELNIK